MSAVSVCISAVSVCVRVCVYMYECSGWVCRAESMASKTPRSWQDGVD